MTYVLLRAYKLLSTPLFCKVASRLISEEYRRAVNYVSIRYGALDLTPEDVFSSAISLSIITAVNSSLILIFLLRFNILSGLVLSFLLFVAAYILAISYPLKIYHYDRSIFSRYAFFILKELCLVLLSTHSIIDAIAFVKSGNYPMISRDFNLLLMNCINGCPPEKLLREYAFNQPSVTLRQGLIAIANMPEISASTLNFTSKYSSTEIRRIYREQSAKLELYCLLIIVQGLLFPFTYMFLLFYLGFSLSPLVFLLVPLQLILLVFTSKALASHAVELLG